MNTVCQEEIRRLADKPTLISPENMTTGDCSAQVSINAPDGAAMLMSRPGKGDQLAEDDDVTAAEPSKPMDEVQQLVGNLAIRHVA